MFGQYRKGLDSTEHKEMCVHLKSLGLVRFIYFNVFKRSLKNKKTKKQ